MKKRKEIKGRIILFQEERFRIVDEMGRSFLFDLSQKSAVNSEDLTDWIRKRTLLKIYYEGEPETETGVAHSIKAA